MADIGNNDRIQLKQEELVGNEVVLTDINPKTNSRSVDDATTGATLDKTIERMWQSINNKLSRIVNSVNGRTGVVVLSAEDVGLDKVDNVSLGDIKQWVINRMTTEFGHKRLILFDRLEQVTEYISDNDKSHRDKPFYCHHGFNGDKRAYIGYTEWDDGSQSLIEHHMVIDTIGFTDNSLIYNENIEGKTNFAGGGLGVNIYTYEDALELYNAASGNKADSGLRINKEKLVPKMFYFDGAYGNGTVTDESAFLYCTKPPTTDTPTIDIYIDGYHESTNYLRMNNVSDKYKFKVGDIVFCSFKDYRSWQSIEMLSDNYYQPTDTAAYMSDNLMYRGLSVGYVTEAPDNNKPNISYVIKFYTIGNLDDSFSFTKMNHKVRLSDSVNKRQSMELKIARAPYITDPSFNAAISPLDVVRDKRYSFNASNNEEGVVYTVYPHGREKQTINKRTDTMSDMSGGIFLNTDMSLCLQPFEMCVPITDFGSTSDNTASHTALNWNSRLGEKPVWDEAISQFTNQKYNVNTLLSIENNNQAIRSSYLGINVLKSVDLEEEDKMPNAISNRYLFTNLSGLRIAYSNQKINRSYLGLNGDEKILGDNNYMDRLSTDGPQFGEDGMLTSGGLSVNVGHYLEIGNNVNGVSNNDFYENGKVNVRTGNGIGDDGNNRLTVKLRGNATGFDANGCVNVHVAFYTTGVEYQMGTTLYIPTTASVDGETKDVTLVGTVLQSFIATTYENDKDKIGKICQIVGKVIAP